MKGRPKRSEFAIPVSTMTSLERNHVSRVLGGTGTDTQQRTAAVAAGRSNNAYHATDAGLCVRTGHVLSVTMGIRVRAPEPPHSSSFPVLLLCGHNLSFHTPTNVLPTFCFHD